MRIFVTLLLIALIAFSIVQTATNLAMVEEFKTHKTISGTLEDFYSETRTRSVGLSNYRTRETSYYFYLKEYTTLFTIGRMSEKAFNWEEFVQLELGTKLSLKVEHGFTDIDDDTTTPSLIWTKDQNFIDDKVRDLERKKNGLLAFFFVFAFIGGLIHHIKNPWI